MGDDLDDLLASLGGEDNFPTTQPKSHESILLDQKENDVNAMQDRIAQLQLQLGDDFADQSLNKAESMGDILEQVNSEIESPRQKRDSEYGRRQQLADVFKTANVPETPAFDEQRGRGESAVPESDIDALLAGLGGDNKDSSSSSDDDQNFGAYNPVLGERDELDDMLSSLSSNTPLVQQQSTPSELPSQTEDFDQFLASQLDSVSGNSTPSSDISTPISQIGDLDSFLNEQLNSIDPTITSNSSTNFNRQQNDVPVTYVAPTPGSFTPAAANSPLSQPSMGGTTIQNASSHSVPNSSNSNFYGSSSTSGMTQVPNSNLLEKAYPKLTPAHYQSRDTNSLADLPTQINQAMYQGDPNAPVEALGTLVKLTASQYAELAKQLIIAESTVRKRFETGQAGLSRFAPMQLRKALQYLNDNLGINDATVINHRDKEEMVAWIRKNAYNG